MSDRVISDASAIYLNWNGHVHHTALLASTMLEATVAPEVAVRVHSDVRWTGICNCMAQMDRDEKAVIAALAGVTRDEAEYPYQGNFNRHLRALINRPTVAPFFEISEQDDGTHYSVRPAGFDRPGGLESLTIIRNRRELRQAPLPSRVVIALLTAAYGNADLAREAFKGPGLALKAGDAAVALNELPADFRNDALLLAATFCGW
ncbi:hypothetical protein [Caenispirillum salinarum]|uniref:hypothetical protein n=1 Tax=Caenispirillum salinarum TaxID=859058 RepID=UPI0012673319|nr:hypothetical protein [Caenispirillum salinarum]